MRINKHTYTWSQGSFSVKNERDCAVSELSSELTKLENLLSGLYLKEQENKIGIKSLGNSIRNSEDINKIFFDSNENTVSFKMTENKRAFLYQLVEYIHANPNRKIVVYILEKQFGKESKLVDGTFLTITDADKQINKLLSVFNPIHPNLVIEFREIIGFSNYNVWSDGKYSKIFNK